MILVSSLMVWNKTPPKLKEIKEGKEEDEQPEEGDNPEEMKEED